MFEAEAWPIIQQKQALWPYASRDEALRAFEACAGMVQTRSFHMSKTNHMTGVSEEGGGFSCVLMKSSWRLCLRQTDVSPDGALME